VAAANILTKPAYASARRWLFQRMQLSQTRIGTVVEAFFQHRMDSPIGAVLLVFDDAGRLRALDFEDYERRMHQLLQLQYRAGPHVLTDRRAPASLTDPIDAYFAGDITGIDALPVETGGTAFQREYWRELRHVPAGTTTTYGTLAQTLGRPRAARAIGAANGQNPVSIVVPCHRVIGSDGSLIRYGGGIERKRWLLEHERTWRSARP